MTSQKDIAKKQAEIVGQLQQFPIGRTNSGGRAGGMVEVVVTNPLPGQPRVVQAKCANDCPPGEVQLLRADDGSYVALSRSAAQKTSETTTRQVSRKNPTIPKKEEEFWPVTSCFLYSKLEEIQEDFTDNIATDLTSYDAWQSVYVTGSPTNERVILFTQRSDLMGDYETAIDALNNNLKEDRKLKPGNTGAGSGGAADDAAWGSGTADAVRVWFYIGEPSTMASVATTSKIINVEGPPYHPSSGNIKNSGPGYCLVIGSGFISSAIFPDEQMGNGPLTEELLKSFPDLGGRIGYWGGIAKWRGVTDYASGVTYYRHTAFATETAQTPTSFPASYIPGTSQNPWLQTDSNWFQFGWGTIANPMYIGCIVSSHVNVETSFINALSCGAAVPPESWFWGGNTAPYMATIDKYRYGWDGYNNLMYVCWEGHKDNIGLAQSFFEAFRTYWGLPGSVIKLASCNKFGCEIPAPGGGGGYPSPPPGLRRFLVKQLGKKAGIYLKVCEKDYPPIELKLPFKFAALIEKFIIQGSPGVNGWTNNQTNVFLTLGGNYGGGYALSLECPHATMSIDGEFIYIDILYGGERVWEVPLSKPIPCKLSNLGASDFTGTTWYRQLAQKESYALIVGEYNTPNAVERAPRYKADYFTYCQSYKIALPTSPTNKTLTIVGSQKYRRGEIIQLTAKSPDNEFNNKFLIYDFRTDKREDLRLPPSAGPITNFASWQSPNPEYASFGGLPALLQLSDPGYSIPSLAYFNAIEKFYKPQSVWTDMDKIHFHLLEAPETFYPLNTVLPVGEFTALYTTQSHHVRFMLDGKFGRGSRAASIDLPSAFAYESSSAPTYSTYSNSGRYLLFTSFKEQLIGNGIKNSGGLVVKWNRVSSSSFPIFGQIKRNP